MGRLTMARSPLDGGGLARQPALARGSARQRGYTAKWDRASKSFLRANPLCRGCKAGGRTAASEVTDHVIPHRGDHRRFWDRRFWQPACRWHHDFVKPRLERMFDEGTIDAADLWLDSDVAVAVAKQAAAGQGVGG